MENLMRVVREAVETLEEYLPDLPECAETPSEQRELIALVNRLIRLSNQTKQELTT